MNFIMKIGQFLRLIDENSQLSLTNISVYVSLYKLITAPQAGYTEIGTFLLAAAAYNYKKYALASQKAVDTASDSEVQLSADKVANDIDELKSKVAALILGKSLGK